MSEQAVIETIEGNVDEVVEAVVPEVYSLAKAISTNKGLVVGAVVVGIAVGAAAGYYIANKHLKTKYELILENEIEAAKNFYAAQNKDQFPVPVPATMDEQPQDIGGQTIVGGLSDSAERAFIDYSGGTRKTQVIETDDSITIVESTESEVVEHNIFIDGNPLDREQWDQGVEESKRTENFPYIISADEFFENEHGYDQSQLTYYAGDNTLVDDSDNGELIPDYSIIGEENLGRFGHGSNDAHLVYIRNPRKEMEFEIALSEGKYSEEVAGVDNDDDDDETEDQLTARRRIRAGRGGDDD